MVKLMSSPGAGKTALLERTLELMHGKLRLEFLKAMLQTTLRRPLFPLPRTDWCR